MVSKGLARKGEGGGVEEEEEREGEGEEEGEGEGEGEEERKGAGSFFLREKSSRRDADECPNGAETSVDVLSRAIERGGGRREGVRG